MTTAGEWPIPLDGIIECVTTTRGPDGRWNAAALGIHTGPDHRPNRHVTARTWGHTRTRRNFDHNGRGYVQFVSDPVLFAEAALGIHETDDPLLDEATAWTAVDVRRVDDGETNGTSWVEWALHPIESEVRRRAVPRINRGTGAVIEATVAASRLGEPAFDDEVLTDRLEYFASVVERCGGSRELEALARTVELSPWTPESSLSAPSPDSAGRPG